MQFLGSTFVSTEFFDRKERRYIVVETSVSVTPGIEKIKREFGVEIFELDEHAWPTFLDCFHEFSDKFPGLEI